MCAHSHVIKLQAGYMVAGLLALLAMLTSANTRAALTLVPPVFCLTNSLPFVLLPCFLHVFAPKDMAGLNSATRLGSSAAGFVLKVTASVGAFAGFPLLQALLLQCLVQLNVLQAMPAASALA
jgi:hypothetical protein